jgi:predicted DNA-binding protein YlxM (UPF0122 family)
MISTVDCDGHTCPTCPVRDACNKVCDTVSEILPSMESGRVDYEDLEKLAAGRLMTRIILDNEHLLTDRQGEIVRLYYRETMLQKEIATELEISQQAVSDTLQAVKDRIWKTFRKNRKYKKQRREEGGIF